jgi:uncharacterized membrane protein YkvA (DUF1232 family)
MRDVLTVYIAARDPRVSLWLKLLALVTAAYALSPLDLVPDFIPIVGYLDDLLLVPLGLWLVLRSLPKPLLQEFRSAAELRFAGSRPVSMWGAAFIVALWVIGGYAVWLLLAGG